MLDIIGVGILLSDEMTHFAANIRQSPSTFTGRWWQNVAFRSARKFGSKDPLDRDVYLSESFSKKFWGFMFLIVGFVFQIIAILHHY